MALALPVQALSYAPALRVVCVVEFTANPVPPPKPRPLKGCDQRAGAAALEAAPRKLYVENAKGGGPALARFWGEGGGRRGEPLFIVDGRECAYRRGRGRAAHVPPAAGDRQGLRRFRAPRGSRRAAAAGRRGRSSAVGWRRSPVV